MNQLTPWKLCVSTLRHPETVTLTLTLTLALALAPTSLELRSAGGHIVHLGSALGQLDALPLAEYKESIRNAKTIQELMDLRYPADEIAKVRAVLYQAIMLRVRTSIPVLLWRELQVPSACSRHA